MLLSSLKSLMLIRTDLIFYILAIIFFCGFVVVLLWYLLSVKKENNTKPTKSWTIESAKKFLETNNIKIDEESNKKANQNTATNNSDKENIESKNSKPQKAVTVKKAPTKKTSNSINKLKNNFK